jgi:hypothetical protein
MRVRRGDGRLALWRFASASVASMDLCWPMSYRTPIRSASARAIENAACRCAPRPLSTVPVDTGRYWAGCSWFASRTLRHRSVSTRSTCSPIPQPPFAWYGLPAGAVRRSLRWRDGAVQWEAHSFLTIGPWDGDRRLVVPLVGFSWGYRQDSATEGLRLRRCDRLARQTGTVIVRT